MTLYKVRMFVNERAKRGKRKGILDRIRYQETTIIDNLDAVHAIFKEYKNDAQTYSMYSQYSGKVELFIPHIHRNGELASWPSGEEYIERYEFPKE